MGKIYDENGDVILTQDQEDLCRLSNYLYDSVDRLFILEDEREDFDIHSAVLIYQDAVNKIEEIIKQPLI